MLIQKNSYFYICNNKIIFEGSKEGENDKISKLLRSASRGSNVLKIRIQEECNELVNYFFSKSFHNTSIII